MVNDVFFYRLITDIIFHDKVQVDGIFTTIITVKVIPSNNNFNILIVLWSLLLDKL